MWRSEPQMPLASTQTTTSSAAETSGSGFSSIRTCSGAWKVMARMRRRTLPAPNQESPLVDAGDLEAAFFAADAGGLFDPRLERQLLLEVGRLAVLEGDVFALEQLDEDLDEAGVELFAGDAAKLDDRVVARPRHPVGVTGGHHGLGDRDGVE